MRLLELGDRRAASEVGIASATGKNCASEMKPSVISSPNEEKITDSQSTIRGIDILERLWLVLAY